MQSLTHISRSTSSVQLQNLLYRMERRTTHARAWTRENDDIVRQLGDLAAATWPDLGLQSVELALRALQLLETAAERSEGGHRHFIAASDLVAIRLAEALEATGEEALVFVDELLAYASNARIVPSLHVARLLAEHAHPHVLESLSKRVFLEHRRASAGGRFAEMVPTLTGPVAGPSRSRELALLLVTLHLALDRIDEALEVLDGETGADPRVFELGGDVLLRAGRSRDAIDRYRRAAVLSPEPSGIREKLLLHALEARNADLLLEQLVWLTERHEDLMYWHLVNDELGDEEPDLLATLRDGLRERSVGVTCDILRYEHDIPGVIALSAGKSFSAAQLWDMAEFLSDHDLKVAGSLYERAVLLEGSTVQSRSQINDFIERVRRIIPFFEDLGRPTKPRRLAREVLSRQKHNGALRRELERLFEMTF